MNNKEKIYDIIIIGAGASGLFFGSTFKQNTTNISSALDCLILEKTERIGTKLLMSGAGSCNLTHAGSIKDFVSCYGTQGKLVRSALFKFNNNDMMNFFQEGGIPLITREDGKVFPKSMNALNVRDFLVEKCEENGFSFVTNCRVDSVLSEKNHYRLQTAQGTYLCKNLVIATGGASYPTTGSDGTFFNILKRDLNVKITKLRPALSSVKVKDYAYADFAGIAFRDTLVTVWRNGKKICENKDDLLLTHNDFSGPAIINISKYILPDDILTINYTSNLTQKEALKIINKNMLGKRDGLSNVISKEFKIPKRFSQFLVKTYGEKHKLLAGKITSDQFTVDYVSGFNTAMATTGGIEMDQINPTTMEFRKLPHLYAIGEALDIDGITGGYNLQFAYSSAKLAASKLFR